jgi:hypothetical protein
MSWWEITKQKTGKKEKKVARDFNNSSDRRIDGIPERRRRQAVLVRWERERGRRWFRKRSAQGMSKRQPAAPHLAPFLCRVSCRIGSADYAYVGG